MNPTCGLTTPYILAIIAGAIVVGALVVWSGTHHFTMTTSKEPVIATTTETVSTVTMPATPGNSSPAAVAGMNKYTDAEFGFSFWYPSDWTVVPTQSPVDHCFESGGCFSGGTMNKILEVKNSDGEPVITIGEFHSESMVVMDDGGAGPFGPVKYWFDASTHTWMRYGQAEFGAPDEEVIATSTADISTNNSMGGLHLFSGTSRFDTRIIPLSAHNFVIIKDQGGANATPLATTVVALNPAVATPITTIAQTGVIQSEQAAYAGN